MPIRRELYPVTWQAISNRIRFDRAGGRCEACGVEHGAVGARDANGQWRNQAEIEAMTPTALGELYPDLANRQMITIYLQTSHHDRDPSNNGEFNLAAYCQACHLAHDRYDNWQRRRRNQIQRQVRAGQMELIALRGRGRQQLPGATKESNK